MRGRTINLEGLLELPTLADGIARRANFREGLTNLAHAITLDGPSPLEGLSPQLLERAVEVARSEGLFEQLDWLGAEALGPALYELAAALPTGTEKRELGRRVYAMLHEGAAPTFAAIATRMALGSRRGLGGPALRARMALVFALPSRAVDAGPLAYTLAARRELAREWIVAHATSSLSSRRLAGRILERAAMIAARRAVHGDDFAPRIFATDTIAVPMARLLADRESLVYRHVAVARGLLAAVSEAHWSFIVEGLHPGLSPTEWRRAAVSLSAALAIAPERARPLLFDTVLDGDLAERDQGLRAVALWGLPRVFELEPELAEQVLVKVLERGGPGVLEATCSLLRELAVATEVQSWAGTNIVEATRREFERRLANAQDDEERRLITALLPDIENAEGMPPSTVREAVRRALVAYASESAPAAHSMALVALDRAKTTIERLRRPLRGAARLRMLVDPDPVEIEEENLLSDLLDLDMGMLEDGALVHLVSLGEARTGPPNDLVALRDRLGRLLIDQEQSARPSRGPSWPAGGSLSLPARREGRSASPGRLVSSRRLIALLHLVDHDTPPVEEGDEIGRGESLQHATAAALFARLAEEDGSSTLHRAVCATLARALDALVRSGACEPADVMLVSSMRLPRVADVTTVGEASMMPDVEGVLTAWVRFVTGDDEGEGEASLLARCVALSELADSLGDDGTGRADALRSVLSRLARTLMHLLHAASRASLLDPRTSADEELAKVVHGYAQIVAGARVRVLGDDAVPTSTTLLIAPPKLARTLGRIAEPRAEDAREAVSLAMREVDVLLPPPIARIVGDVLRWVVELPFAVRGPAIGSQKPPRGQELPAWLGPRRTLGGFWIVRPLGAGAASTVFVAKRIEERTEPQAELFALKVPEYDGAAARSLSEQEFLAIFRAEASTLLGLPSNPNLARFVTFDLAARPKPILVMELIEGPTLDRFLATQLSTSSEPMNVGRALSILDGVAAGLEVMHRHGIGHLDVKPSNVILRNGVTPTLVDFGLAGRHIRPGCATGSYGAPEVWGLALDGHVALSPLPADVYSFGALIYELLTGQVLFEGDNELSIIAKHVLHDGHPEQLEKLRAIRPLVELLEHTLRRDPRERWTIAEVRRALGAISRHVSDFAWPLGAI